MLRHQLAVVVHRDVEREPVLDGVAAVDDRLDGGVDVVALGLGEEADVAEVHPEHRGRRSRG